LSVSFLIRADAIAAFARDFFFSAFFPLAKPFENTDNLLSNVLVLTQPIES
jgi:hypothetical protein